MAQQLIPSSTLIDSLPSLAYIGLTENYMDHLARMAWNPIDTNKIVDAKVKKEIDNINLVCQTTLTTAKKHAKIWSASSDRHEAIRDQVQAMGDMLYTFAEQWDSNTAIITEIAEVAGKNEIIEQIIADLEKYNAQLSLIQKQVNGFLVKVKIDVSNFEKEFELQKQLLTSLTKFYEEVATKIQQLQKEVDDLNDKVTEKAIQTTIEDVKDGILAISSAADEDYGETVKQVLTITYKTLKAEVESVILEKKALDLVEEIIKLTKELRATDIALLRLRDLGNHLRTMNKHALRFTSSIEASSIFFHDITNSLKKIQKENTANTINWKQTMIDWERFKTKASIVKDALMERRVTIPIWKTDKVKLVSK